MQFSPSAPCKEGGTIMHPLVVTTAHRGVFFGYGEPTSEATIVLEKVRMCMYWPAEVKGVLGLTVTGPLKGSRVGPACPRLILRDVTAVMDVSVEAVDRWEASPWL